MAMSPKAGASNVANEVVSVAVAMDEAPLRAPPPFPPTPILRLSKCHIRPYHPTDAAPIAHHANNPLISRWMTNIFPSPYTLSDGIEWVNCNLSLSPPENFVIADPTTSLAIGGIGLKPGTDVHERSVEVGYWLGEEFWGRGVATKALVGFVGWGLGEREWEWERAVRVHAGVYGGNVASGRVLRKAGFGLEGCLRKHVWKEGRLLDLEVYAVLREEWEGRERERVADEGLSAEEMSI